MGQIKSVLRLLNADKGSVERQKRTKTSKRTGIYQNALRLLDFYEHVYEFGNVILFMLNIDTGVISLGFG